jgi:hypothetical protein
MGQSFYDLLKDAAFAGGGGGSPAPAPVLIEKSVTQNGTYSAQDDEADGYSSVSVNVPNTYAAGDEGKVVSNGALVTQTATSTTTNGTIDTTTNNSVTVNVPNTYTASDEGKVVSNGALVAQGSDTVTQNGTVDTTLISSLLVNVSGGGGGIYKLTNPASVTRTNSEFYVAETENYFYFFGRVYFNNISSGNALFTFPEGFDISKIGTFIRAIRLLESNNSTVPAAAYTFDTQNRTVQIYLYKEWGDYVAVYSKST